MNAPGNNYLQLMQSTSLLSGGNNAFVEGLYEDYLRDASSVPAEWRAYFDKLQTASAQHDVAHSPIQRGFLQLDKRPAEAPVHADDARKQASVLQLINAHRFLGVRVADLDPLSRHAKPEVAELNLSYYNLGEADLDTTFNTGSLVGWGAHDLARDQESLAPYLLRQRRRGVHVYQQCAAEALDTGASGGAQRRAGISAGDEETHP